MRTWRTEAGHGVYRMRSFRHGLAIACDFTLSRTDQALNEGRSTPYQKSRGMINDLAGRVCEGAESTLSQ
jgi:hypothetical protein